MLTLKQHEKELKLLKEIIAEKELKIKMQEELLKKKDVGIATKREIVRQYNSMGLNPKSLSEQTMTHNLLLKSTKLY